MRVAFLLLCLVVFVLEAIDVVPQFSNATRHTSKPTTHMASTAPTTKMDDKERDCSGAPNEDIKKTCGMMHMMDSMARARLRRQAQLLSSARRTPVSPSVARRRQSLRARLRQTARPTTASPTTLASNSIDDTRADGSPMWQQPVPVPPFARGQTAYHPYDCMTLQCLCPFFQGAMRNGSCFLQNGNGQPLTMAYRKEYRMMTENERNRWHAALNVLKRNGVYDQISREHLEVGIGSGAHSGPGFLPWHREYLKRFEIALRMVDPGVAIPYWDSVMDNYLPDPRDSILFTNMFAGMTDGWGNVVQGPFAYWPTLEGRGTILRNLGQEGQLFTEQQINNVVMQNGIEYIMAYTAPLESCPYPNNWGAIEYIHSNIHLWIGGDMKPPSTSANEPIFFMHHSFVDYMWELWRQLKQPKWLREQAYAPDIGICANQLHHSYSNMRPFPYLVNRDGLSNSYTDQMYRYAPRATCSFERPSCGSPWLFCDTRGYPHCVAKVRFGGNCRGYEGLDVCYMGRCWFGQCVQGPATRFVRRVARSHNNTAASTPTLPLHTAARVNVPVARPTTPPKTVTTTEPAPVSIPLFIDCYNRHPCCDRWSKEGLCGSQPEYMSQYCQSSCEVCSPNYDTTDECADRHPSCIEFRKFGMCSGPSSSFMEENCRMSCKLCSKNKDSVCEVDGELIPIPATKELVLSIRYSFDKEAERKMDALETAVRRRARRGAYGLL